MSNSDYTIDTTDLSSLHTVIHTADYDLSGNLVDILLVHSAGTVQSALQPVDVCRREVTDSKILTPDQQTTCLRALGQRFMNPPSYYNPQYVLARTPFMNFEFIKTILLRNPAALYAIFTLMKHGGEVDFLCIENNQLIFAEMNEYPPEGQGRRNVQYQQIGKFLGTYGAELITPELYTFLLNKAGYFENGHRCIVFTDAETLALNKMRCGELYQLKAFIEECPITSINQSIGFRSIVRVNI